MVKINLRDKVAHGLDIPQEVLNNMPVIKLIGNKELSIENFISLIEFNPQKIRFSTHCGMLVIDGIHLDAKSMTSELVLIRGTIIQIAFVI